VACTKLSDDLNMAVICAVKYCGLLDNRVVHWYSNGTISLAVY
jgi:hypothetical protein